MSFLTLSFKGDIILKNHHTTTSNEMAEVPRSKNMRFAQNIMHQTMIRNMHATNMQQDMKIAKLTIFNQILNMQ